MNVLVIRGHIPYPLDNGANIRTYNLLKRLSSKHNITLISYSDSSKDFGNRKYLQNFYRKVVLVPRNLRCDKISVFLRVLKNIFEKYPYSVKLSYSLRMIKAIKKELNENNYDLIHVDTLPISSNILNFAQIPSKILSQHNVENIILKRKAEVHKNIFFKAFWYWQWKKLRKYEIKVCNEFDGITSVSIEDMKQTALFAPDVPIDVVPNGVDLDYYSKKMHTTKKEGLVFTGSLDWQANNDGLLYFLDQIYPIILEKRPQTKFTIVGKNPSPKLIKTASKYDTISITGKVPDVRPYINSSLVFIVPLRIGGGTRLKILEAMAAEIPVVSTKLGCEGIEIESGKNILIGNSPEEFAENTLLTLNNEELRRILVKEGKDLVAKKYRWEIISGKLENAWIKCVKNTVNNS